MTDPRTTPIRVAAAGEEVLSLSSGTEVLGEIPGSGYRRPPALARRGDGQVVSLTPLLHQVLLAVDGRRTLSEVAARVSESSGRLVRPDDVRHLVDGSLRPLGLLRRADGAEPELRRSNPMLALRLRRAVTDPAVTSRLTAPFAVLFHPLVVAPVVLAFAAVAGWVLFTEGLAAATAQAFGNPALFLALVVLTVLSAGFHEFGHAAAARYGGAVPGAMGVGFYLFWPAFYTDVTDSYRLGRAGRVRTDLGGLYFNAIVVLLSFAVWWITGWHAVLLLVAAQLLQMVRQLAPLLRFDGYHVLADLTGVPDLYQRIGPILRELLPGRRHRPEATALKAWARVVVVAWILVVVPLMAACLLLMVLALPRLLGTAWASLQRQAGLLSAAFGDGDVLGVLARALGVVAVALPVLGIGYVVVRLVRRTALGVWRRTDGRPVRRTLAVLLAAALVAGLAWAWWPAGERYRPVRAWEGGTVLDAVPAADSSALQPGTRGAATTLWPEDAGPLPTADDPALAMVLVPAGGTAARADGGGTDGGTGTPAGADAPADDAPADDAPTWVFPFDRPLPPGDGDNQALAVNTADGSVAYDVSFALVWADGDTAVSRNEAYAVASCTGCRTVAVAFQVVLLIGSVDVVVPENVSAAVNYACVECVTHALATQLVVSVPGQLSAGAGAELARVWEELRAFGERIEEVPLSELQARLTEFEERILAVVREDGGSAEQEPADGAADPSGEPSEPASSGSGSGSGSAETGSQETGAEQTGSGGTEPAPGSTAATDGPAAPSETGDGTATSPSAAPTAEPAESSSSAPTSSAPAASASAAG
jgi:putative peptide zinc metalloprotease protein